MAEERDRSGLTAAEFLQAYSMEKYPRPALTADNVIVRQTQEGMELLLIRRGGHPYLNRWALPGGFANPGETLEETAARELREETGVTGCKMQYVGVFSRPGRDPRGWVVSQAYAALLPEGQTARAADDAKAAAWFGVTLAADHITLKNGETHFDIFYGPDMRAQGGCGLAFDHAQIIAQGLRTLFPAWPAGKEEA